ncbi:MAG: glycosyltransferase [Lachnospiraceae bacterium]|jgi:Glycosyltransferases involved in cell wall biogenesis
MSKVPVSVCIIAKNEEKYIEECLKHLQPYGFEIIVTDTGSTDRTKEIAQKYADKVLDFRWINDFSAARNFCASHASNNWILVLDCDEYMTQMDVNILQSFMHKYPRYTGTMRLKNLVYKQDGSGGYGTDDVTRMYNRKFYGYENPIHEQICSKNISERDKEMPCFLIPAEVIHHGYAVSPEEMEKKQHRNLAILYESLEKTPDNPYLLFQIGQSEFILKNYEKAITYYERGLSMKPPLNYTYVQIMIISLARAYVQVGREADALACMNQYETQCKTAKFTFTHAAVYMDNGQPLKALLLYIKTTLMPDVDTLGENLLHCYEYIIRIYRDMGEEKMAAMFEDKYETCRKEKERILNF